MEGGKTKATLRPRTVSDIKEDGSQYVNELKEFRINNVVQENLEQDESTINDPKKSIYTIPVEGNSEYQIYSRYEREYSLKNENFKIMRVDNVTDGMVLDISYPENVSVSFFNIGVIHNFEPYLDVKGQRMSLIHRKGLIFKNQGFGLSFERHDDRTVTKQ